MPTPRCSDESRSDWMSRCIPVVMDEGRTHDQAVGQCAGMWNSAWEDKQIDLDEIYQCTNCSNAMKLSDWYEGYDKGLKEFWCPKCNQIIDMEFLEKWKEQE